jgi:hypothetical protein
MSSDLESVSRRTALYKRSVPRHHQADVCVATALHLKRRAEPPCSRPRTRKLRSRELLSKAPALHSPCLWCAPALAARWSMISCVRHSSYVILSMSATFGFRPIARLTYAADPSTVATAILAEVGSRCGTPSTIGNARPLASLTSSCATSSYRSGALVNGHARYRSIAASNTAGPAAEQSARDRTRSIAVADIIGGFFIHFLI